MGSYNIFFFSGENEGCHSTSLLIVISWPDSQRTFPICKLQSISNWTLCDRGFHNGVAEDLSILGYCPILTRKSLPTFRRIRLPLHSGSIWPWADWTWQVYVNQHGVVFHMCYMFNGTLYRVILSVLDPRKCEYLKDYSLDFEHAYMTTHLASWKACRY